MISCAQYDYIEIVCLFHYPIEIIGKSGEVVHGVAIDTQKDEQRNECILVKTSSSAAQLIELDTIKTLRVMVDNPHFSEFSFAL